MLRNKLCEIFHKVQQSSSCHQKYRQILINLYNESTFEDFETEFMRCIEHMLWQEVQHKNVYVERCLEFAATFITTVVVTAQNENETQSQSSNDSDNTETHPLLEAMIDNILQYHNLDYVSVRFRTCQFLNLLLRNLGDDAHIDVDLGSAIQTAMLERLQDIKPFIRLQAVKALVRLQQPEDLECPVMRALLSHLYESSAAVRKEVVNALAVTPQMVPKLVERVRDCDFSVRLAAYRKCSMLGPKLITISSRQLIIESGFNEANDIVKRFFLEDTLPKWLSAYNGNFLQLLHALKLDAYEEDLKRTEIISKKVMEVFFKSQQLNSLLECLPIDENKLIPVDKLTTEAVLYWYILTNYLRKSKNTDEYLEEIIPELIYFCSYIEKVFKEYNNKSLQDWQHLEYQQIICQLFQIVGQYDLGDEVGRKALHKLIVDMLMTGKFNNRVITEMIAILEKINPVLDSLTIDICHIISDIREPALEQPPTQERTREYDFRIAELRVKINILTEECSDAVAISDYETAANAKKQLLELNKKVDEVMAECEAAKTVVRVSQNDPETICRCLDILIAMLSHPNLKTLTASLRSCKDEFVTALLSNNNLDIYHKAFKCIALSCMLDRQLTLDNLKLLCTPIILYRLTPNYNKQVLLTSIAAVADLLRLFGTEIFGNTNNETNTTNNVSKRRLNGTRRLYTMNQAEDLDSFDFESITSEDIVDIFLDMLDDENQELREQVGVALCEFVMSKIAVSPSLLSRMILKWFNPMTEKHDQKLQQLLGNTFVIFAQRVENSEEILEKTVVPVLTSLGNAPRTSPLADVDIDNALRFLAAITSIQKSSGLLNSHKNLAYALCYKISAKPEDKCVPIYIKMLLNLELFLQDSVIIQELIRQAELILEDVNDKAPKRNVQKFVFKLNKMLADIANEEENETVGEAESINPNERASVSQLGHPVQSTNSSRASILQQMNTSQRNSTNEQSTNSSRASILQQINTSQRNSTNEQSNNSTRASMLQQINTSQQNSTNEQSNNSSRASMLQQINTTQQKSTNEKPTTNNNVEKNNLKSTSVDKPKTGKSKNKTNKELKNTETVCSLSLRETPILKKRRGRSSRVINIDLTNDEEEETILHTIIENDEHEMGSLEDDDLSIQTPTTSSSPTLSSGSSKRGRPTKSTKSSESSSDTEKPKKKAARRSLRKRKQKKIFVVN